MKPDKHKTTFPGQLSSHNDTILSSVPNIIMQVNEDKVYTWANISGYEFFGDDVIGKEAAYYFEGEQETYGLVSPIFNGSGDNIYVESWQRRRDGEKRLLAWWCKMLKDENGTVRGALSSAVDITEQRRAEESLIESEQKFRNLFEHSPVGKSMTGLDGSLNVNESFCRMLGYSVAELNKKTWKDITHPEDIKQSENYMQSVVNGEIPRARFEKRFIHKNGNVVWADLSTYLQRDKDGKPQFLISTVSDITEQKRMEARIIESEAYYRTLIDLSPDGVFIIDLQGHVTYGSRKTYEIFRIPPDIDVIGTSFLNWVSTDYHEIVFNRVKEILSGNIEPEIREYKLLRYNKEPFWAELSSSPIKDVKGNPGGLLVVCRDITERKRAGDELLKAKEKAEESDRLKTAFLHNISHEIRTPLNAIVGFSAFLDQQDVSDEDRKKYIDIIFQSNSQLLSIVNDIMNISYLETGQIKLKESTANLNQILKNLYNQFHPEIQKKGISFKSEIKFNGAEILVKTDESKLIHIVTNLLNNAVKFTQEGHIILGSGLDGDKVIIYVEDTGIGIPETEQERIFERFYQVDAKKSRIYSGTGLGLSISQGFAHLLGGEITVKSEEGKGSVFSVSIPYSKPEITGRINHVSST